MAYYNSRKTTTLLCIIALLTISFVYVLLPSNSRSIVIMQPELPEMNTSDFQFEKGLTFHCSNGELGNRMFYYAVLYGLSRLNNRLAYVQKCNVNTCRFSEENCALDALDEVFELSLPTGPDLPEEKQIGHAIHFHLRFPGDYHISPTVNILVGQPYPCSVTHFLHVREEIRREFTFRKQIQEHALSYLERIRGSRRNVTFVSVHVRRNTYLEHLNAFGKKEAPREFFIYALDYFRWILPNVLFVVLSDDLDWCRENIVGDDVYVAVSMSSAGEDLAVLSKCQHAIFDYGTYGLWGALLAGGKAMYFVDGITDPTETDNDLAKKMYPPDWIGVSSAMLNSSNHW